MSQAVANLAQKAIETAEEAKKTAEDSQAAIASLHARLEKLEKEPSGQRNSSHNNR